MNTERRTQVELATYDPDAMMYASTSLIHSFARYSKIEGTGEWIRSLIAINDVIQKQQPRPVTLQAEGVVLTFSGIPGLEREQVTAEEPFFTIFDWSEFLLPSGRQRVTKVADAISEEMSEVYKLRREKGNPQKLVFPKQNYAQVQTHAAYLI